MTDDNSTLTVEFENPSIKDQLTAAAISVGAAIAVPIALGVGLLSFGAISDYRDSRKAKKKAAIEVFTTEETE